MTDAGDAVAAYNILRAFSWQIRLSPFAFEELCAALFNPNPSPLMDELHVSSAAATQHGFSLFVMLPSFACFLHAHVSLTCHVVHIVNFSLTRMSSAVCLSPLLHGFCIMVRSFVCVFHLRVELVACFADLHASVVTV